MNDKLKIFTVISHSGSQEVTSTIIAYTAKQACDIAEGDVMHVNHGRDIEPMQVTSSSWNRTKMPNLCKYKEPTKRAVEVLNGN